MKKLFGFFLLGLGLSFGTYAQNRAGGEVPATIKTAFAKQFPGTTAKWVNKGDLYEARFKQKHQEMSAVFAADGALAETAMELKVAQLPLPVKDYMDQHYKRFKIKEAKRITKANGQINYEVCMEDKDVRFDASCILLTEEKGYVRQNGKDTTSYFRVKQE
jgi:hypothetical protein